MTNVTATVKVGFTVNHTFEGKDVSHTSDDGVIEMHKTSFDDFEKAGAVTRAEAPRPSNEPSLPGIDDSSAQKVPGRK